jgi:hypothetical protein
MSQPSSVSGISGMQRPAAEKQKTNIYTMMLILSLIALTTACVLLAMELQRFPWAPWDTKSAQPVVTP